MRHLLDLLKLEPQTCVLDSWNNRNTTLKVWKTVVWQNQNFKKLHLCLQKPKDGPWYHKHQIHNLLCMCQMLSVLLIFVFAVIFSVKAIHWKTWWDLVAIYHCVQQKGWQLLYNWQIQKLFLLIVCAIKEKVNRLWLTEKVTRIKAAFGNCYLHICLEILNPRDTGWVWGSKLVICHQKGKALKVI